MIQTNANNGALTKEVGESNQREKQTEE